MNKNMENYYNDYKKFGIKIDKIKRNNSPVKKAKSFEKFSLLKKSDIAYTSYTSIVDKKEMID